MNLCPAISVRYRRGSDRCQQYRSRRLPLHSRARLDFFWRAAEETSHVSFLPRRTFPQNSYLIKNGATRIPREFARHAILPPPPLAAPFHTRGAQHSPLRPYFPGTLQNVPSPRPPLIPGGWARAIQDPFFPQPKVSAVTARPVPRSRSAQ